MIDKQDSKKFALIPRYVVEDNRLSMLAKNLYSLINLCSKNGVCVKPNRHFCEKLGMCSRSIQTGLKELQNQSYISIDPANSEMEIPRRIFLI